MLNIGILGCGRIGQVHARSIRQIEGARISAVADAFEAPAAALAARSGAAVLPALELINSADVDAVVIGTPTDTHYDLIHAAARAGKAIFCEKPVDMSAARIRDCMAAVTAAGVPFLTAFNRRFDPHFANAQARIAAGEIGAVEIITIQSRDPAPPPISYIQSSGGLFRDMMIHDLDMARFLLGEEPVSVYAVGASLVDPLDPGDAVKKMAVGTSAAIVSKTTTAPLRPLRCSHRWCSFSPWSKKPASPRPST